MKVCALISGNMVGGGVKMPVRLASHLAERHDVTIMYPLVKYYTLNNRVRRSSWAAQIRSVLGGLYHSTSEFVFRADLDPRVTLETYILTPSELSLREFDVIIYESVWQYHELKGLRLPNLSRIHWTLADYVFAAAAGESPDAIREAYLSDDCLVAPSRSIGSDLESYGFKVHEVIHGGVDPLFNAEGRRWTDHEPTVLGYFQPEWWVKGASTLVQCFARIRAKYQNIRLELFGHQGSDIARRGDWLCDRFYTDLSSREVASLCRNHDIFVYPSYTDGFPSPPLEAMACGCAVVATRVGAIPEYAKHEQNALLCDPLDCDEMFRHVERLILDTNLRLKLSRQASVDAPQWTWQNCASKFDRLMQSLRNAARR